MLSQNLGGLGLHLPLVLMQIMLSDVRLIFEVVGLESDIIYDLFFNFPHQTLSLMDRFRGKKYLIQDLTNKKYSHRRSP